MSQEPFGNQVNLPRPPKVSPGFIRFALLAILVVVLASNSIYTVQPDEEGVVLRFGAFVDRTPPGLHGKLPFIDEVIPIKVRRQLTEEFGFRTQQSRERSASRVHSDESNMLTGDLNTAVVEWVVQYRIEDPEQYLFKVRNSRETFRDMSEAVMREAVGDRTVNEVLTVGRQEVTAVVQNKLQTLCELYEIGIHVDQVVLQDVTPPPPVKPAFNEVNQAEQERSQLISEAQAEYNRVVPRAKGEAQQTILAAEGYGLDRVNRAQGEAARFQALYEQYRKAPEVTRRRIYLETMREILPKVGKKVVVDDDVRGMLPLLNLEGSSAAPRRSEGGQ